MKVVPLSPMRRITLLTDFGTRDGYVAAMKGVIHAIAPLAFVDDASHEIEPGDVPAAAFTLARYARRYPPGSIHVIVVDPGVGSARRAIAAMIDEHAYVAPDNGVLTHVLDGARATRIVEITEPSIVSGDVSATFHGRDIFAPAAARLAGGWELDHLGSTVDDAVLLDLPKPKRERNEIRGEVAHVDRFGNLITNIPGAWIPAAATVRIGDTDVGEVKRTYADTAPGATLALIGSDGQLEIAVRDGSAAQILDATRGTHVHVTTRD